MTTTTTTSPVADAIAVRNVFVLRPSRVRYFIYSEVYDPDVTYPDGKVLMVPPLYSLVGGDGTEPNVLFVVTATDSTSYKSTLVPVYLPDISGGFGMSTAISYGNTMFRAYFDTRANPYTLTLDRVVFYGGSPSTYTITRYPNDPDKAQVVSLYYDETGTYAGTSVPMLRLENSQNIWYCKSCNITFVPDDDEELLVKVYSETGMLVATTTVFAKAADIINTALNYRPKIADLVVKGTQTLSTGGFYLYEKQQLSDLGIYGQIVYSTGSTRNITIDQMQTILFGADDFRSAYAGQKQQLMLRYNLSYNETVGTTSDDVTVTVSSISRIFDVTVIANELAAPIKISVIPEWNVEQNAYTLYYYYYSTTHNRAVDVTSAVSVVSGSFTGNYYLNWQSFSFGLDMNVVDPATYPGSTNYTQSVAIKLQPPAALVRYMISDSTSSPYVYGADSSTSRRPVMFFDSSIGKYFIASSLFGNTAALLQSFYYNANPPIDNTTETALPVPTHFTVRNAFTGAQILATPIALADYAIAFSLINGVNGDYVNAAVIVEFLQQVDSGNNLILYGVPVDVGTATYIGPMT